MSTKILYPVCDSLVELFLPTARDFALDCTHPLQTLSVPVKLTPRSLEVIRNNFYPMYEYLQNTLMFISHDRPKLLCHSSFMSLASSFSSIKLVSASYPSDGYLFTFK